MCLSDVRCVPPPPAPHAAGLRVWNGNVSYGATASYKCGNYAQFKDSDENLYDSITLTCQWNRAWSRDLDECSWSHCPIVPDPPLGSNLVFHPPNGSSLLMTTSDITIE